MGKYHIWIGEGGRGQPDWHLGTREDVHLQRLYCRIDLVRRRSMHASKRKQM